MDFDHLSDDKVDAVSRLINQGCSWETLLKEIEKCDLICSNCHRILTFDRLQVSVA